MDFVPDIAIDDRRVLAGVAVALVDRLTETKVTPFRSNMPEANDLTVGIMALVAQAEREAISRRTKEALAVAKSRGVKLGNPNGAASLRKAGKGGEALRAAVSANAAAFAADLAPVLADIRAGGHTSLRAVAAELTRRGIRTRRSGTWSPGNVRALVARYLIHEIRKGS